MSCAIPPPPLYSEQVISPQRIPATVAPSLLMSPMVFSQSAPTPPKPNENGWLPVVNQEATSVSAKLLPMQNPELPAADSNPLTKQQLQETLLHLIQVNHLLVSRLDKCAYLYLKLLIWQKKNILHSVTLALGLNATILMIHFSSQHGNVICTTWSLSGIKRD